MQHAPATTRSTPRRATHRYLGAALGLALTTLVCASPGTASAQPIPSAPPQLSISVDNGHQTTKKGDELRYTVVVTNLGTTKIKDLVVTQTVPVGSTFVSADADGSHAKQGVSWELNLKSTKKVVLHTSLKVASPPDTLLRLATVVCAQVTKGRPIVCASDSDLLPAGAAAEVTASHADSVSWGEAVMDRRWWFAGGGLALIMVAGAALVVIRRRGHTPSRTATSRR